MPQGIQGERKRFFFSLTAKLVDVKYGRVFLFAMSGFRPVHRALPGRRTLEQQWGEKTDMR